MRNIEEMIHRQLNRWNNVVQTLHYPPGRSAEPEVSAQAEAARRHPVVCLSRDLGSGARQIADRLCERLGYELIGSSLIDEIAKDLNVQRSLIDSLDESGRSEVEVFVETFLRGRGIDKHDYIASLIRIVQTIALKGGVVLLGRGAGLILGDSAALYARITCPVDERIRRLMSYERISEDEASEHIRRSDNHRASFIRKMFKQDIHDPSLFDLVLNTGRFTTEQAVELICAALEQRGYDLEKMTVRLETA